MAELSVLRRSLACAEASMISYLSPEECNKAAGKLGFVGGKYFSASGAQAYWFWSNHDSIVVFRGTEPNEWNDIKADVNALTVLAETAGRVHRGFKREVDDLWPRLERALKDNEKPLWFAGHSLGGAMATICAGRCKLAEIPSNPAGLFTYGSPRVGTKRYINYVKIPHYRWVNNNDIVARVPPTWMGYRHGGRELYFNCFGRLRKYSTMRRFRDSWYGFMLSLRKFKIDHLIDHSMVGYLKNIKQAIDDESARRIKPLRKDVSTP
jgi:triacylglycerol lipase